MENVLFYLLIILCLGLIITTAVYMNKYNTTNELLEDKFTQCLRLEGDKKSLISDLGLTKLDVSRKDKEITVLKNSLEEQKQISNSINEQLAKSFIINNKLIQKCDKQHAEIESLQSINATLLADNRKLADQISNTVPDKMETKTKRHK